MVQLRVYIYCKCGCACSISFVPKKYIEAFKLGLPVPDETEETDSASVNPKMPNKVKNFAAIKSMFEAHGKGFEQL